MPLSKSAAVVGDSAPTCKAANSSIAVRPDVIRDLGRVTIPQRYFRFGKESVKRELPLHKEKAPAAQVPAPQNRNWNLQAVKNATRTITALSATTDATWA